MTLFTKMKFCVLLAMLAFASKNKNDAESAAENLGGNIMENAENPILVKIEEDECTKKKTSNYVGIYYDAVKARWRTQRWSQNKYFRNGSYKDEETAALASDTLARKLMAHCTQNLKLNFPDYNTDVYPEKKKTSSKYIGVSYNEDFKRWEVHRWSKNERKNEYNGVYKDEETAANASDTLARKLIAEGEQGHKLNFPDDITEVHPEKKTVNSKYFGIYYNEKYKKWMAQRWSKTEKKMRCNGHYKDEETAAHASDTLARKLMANGEEDHKLNFFDDNTKVLAEYKKINQSKYIGVYYYQRSKQWQAQRRSKMEKKTFSNGYHKDELSAAVASDSLARKLMANGDQCLKLNFPDEKTHEHQQEHHNKKRKRPFDFEYSQTDESNL